MKSQIHKNQNLKAIAHHHAFYVILFVGIAFIFSSGTGYAQSSHSSNSSGQVSEPQRNCSGKFENAIIERLLGGLSGKQVKSSVRAKSEEDFKSYKLIREAYRVLSNTAVGEILSGKEMSMVVRHISEIKDLENDFKAPRLIAHFIVESVEKANSCDPTVWPIQKIENYVLSRLRDSRKMVLELGRSLDLREL